MRISRASFTRKYGIAPCTTHTGKMHGMHSLSTSVQRNPICMKRAKDPTSICHACFANAMCDIYPDLEPKLARNFEALTRQIIPVEEWFNIWKREYYRLESFGDLANVTQAINYINFATANPQTTITQWTKNPAFIAQAFAMGYKKPANLIIIQSSVHVNVVDRPYADWIDGVFTVYTEEYAKEHGITINCGARHCLSCLRCYKHHEGLMYINELLK